MIEELMIVLNYRPLISLSLIIRLSTLIILIMRLLILLLVPYYIFCHMINPSYVFAPVRINQNVSRFPAVGVSVGTVPPAHRIVANHHSIVEGVVPCSIDIMNTWLFVTFATVNVIAVPVVFPVTMCILSSAQSIFTV